MGSPLSPAFYSFFLKNSGEVAIGRPAYKPTCWYRYVDDIRDQASWTKRAE